MDNYLKDVRQLLKNKGYVICMLCVAVLSYGYAALNISIGVDDLLADHYVGSGNAMLAAGRFGICFWDLLRGPWDNFYFTDFLAVVLLLAATVNFCILFSRASRNHIGSDALTIFSCVFVSYPLVVDIWEYTGANVCVTGGYLFTSLCLLIVQQLIHQNKKKWGLLLPAGFMMTIVCAGYESIVSVYIFFTFAVLALQGIYGTQNEKKCSHMIRQGLCYAALLVAGVVLRLVIHKLTLVVLNIPYQANGATHIGWLEASPFSCLKGLLVSSVQDYLLRAIVYFPLTELLLAIVVYLCIGIPVCKKHGASLLMPGAGMLLSLLALQILQGSATPYRTCQVFGAFTAFVAMVLIHILPQNRCRRIAVVLCGCLCVYQASFVAYFLEMNHRRSQDEAFMVRQIAVDLQRNNDTKKPVIFVGSHANSHNLDYQVSIPEDSIRWRLYEDIHGKLRKLIGREDDAEPPSQRLPQTNGDSVINWSIWAFDQEAMVLLFSYYGYDYIPADYKAVSKQAAAYAKQTDMPRYPSDGYIQDVGDYIIVNLQ